jgi:hypothetical protein
MKEVYIRVECVDKSTGESRGGYMCAIMMMLAILLDVSPDIDMELFVEKLDKTENPIVQNLLVSLIYLGDIPKPNIYEADKVNNVCLYTENEFYEAIYALASVADMLVEITDDQYSLQYKQFVIEEEDILYEDLYQIVLSKETYNERKDDYPYYDVRDLRDELEGDEWSEDLENEGGKG